MVYQKKAISSNGSYTETVNLSLNGFYLIKTVQIPESRKPQQIRGPVGIFHGYKPQGEP